VIATFHAAGDSPSYKYLKVSIKPAAANIAHAVAVSKDAAELVRRYIGGDYEILYNGVELDTYRDSPAHPTTGPTIFFCGRHEERKGLDVLLAAVQELGPEVRVWVGSTGPDSARLQVEYAKDPRIEWLGRLTDADKVARLRGADVFCAPSLHGESFGVVLIEAMAAETAIVASGLDGYRNVATDGVDALLVEPGDVGELAVALKRALFEPGLSESLQRAGSERAKEFSMTALAQRYAEHYLRLATNRPKRDGPPTRESFLRGWRRRMMAD
jgi:phosphatidylinositol alpha-mannosyltransferase